MNRTAMVNYILACYRGDADLDELKHDLMFMPDSNVKNYFDALQTDLRGNVPPPDPSDAEPLNYNHIDI